MPAHTRSVYPGTRSRVAGGGRAHEAVFSSLSRELRLSLGEDDRLLLVEGAWQSVLGWRPERLRGRHWKDFVHPADRGRMAQALDLLRSHGGCEHDLELWLARATGGHRLTRWTLVPGPEPGTILGLGHDRTDAPEESATRTLLQRRNVELAERLSELEDRYAAVERFAGMAAHQLAEPLVIAESSAILIAEELGEDLDPLLRGRLDAIGRGAARARRLMDALLADARTSGRPLPLETVHLDAVVEETVRALAPQVEARDANVVVEALPRVRGEGELLAVVFENLLSNALKYGPAGGTIRVFAEPQADGWFVGVAGEGAPIPERDAGMIFEPFRRAAGERRTPGVGLGLAICSRLMARMRGSIGIEPGATSGNTFWIRVPGVGQAPVSPGRRRTHRASA